MILICSGPLMSVTNKINIRNGRLKIITNNTIIRNGPLKTVADVPYWLRELAPVTYDHLTPVASTVAIIEVVSTVAASSSPPAAGYYSSRRASTRHRRRLLRPQCLCSPLHPQARLYHPSPALGAFCARGRHHRSNAARRPSSLAAAARLHPPFLVKVWNCPS